jgi:hypothetical protein
MRERWWRDVVKAVRPVEPKIILRLVSRSVITMKSHCELTNQAHYEVEGLSLLYVFFNS